MTTTNTWEFYSQLQHHATKNPDCSSTKTLILEFKRLNIQKCSYCSGFGHSANDCPTDAKLRQLRVGTAEQTEFMKSVRAEAKLQCPMKDAKGFSKLTANLKSHPLLVRCQKYEKKRNYVH